MLPVLPTLALVAWLATAPGADANRGKTLFEARCSLCHGIGTAPQQGPGLGGVLGRTSASAKNFAYSPALQKTHLTWDRDGLDRFLEAPSKVVPGTAMIIATPNRDERASLIEYLATLRATEVSPAAISATSLGVHHPVPGKLLSGPDAYGDYRDDAPGVRRHFTVQALPAVFASQAVSARPTVVPRPAEAQLAVPPGFQIAELSRGLVAARLLRVAPNGDVFVAQSYRNQISVLRLSPDGSKVVETKVFAQDLARPFGMAFYPPGSRPEWLYVALTESVIRIPYQLGDLEARGRPETVVPELAPHPEGGHWTRDLAFSRDGLKLFVSIGSSSNVADGMPDEPSGGLESWEKDRVLGEAWGSEEYRADVQVFDPEGGARRVFATGLRNCVGLAVHPRTGDLWCSVNERDNLGDDLVPDYVTRVREGSFYGWPWYYLGPHVDPRLPGARPDLLSHITVPDVLVQPHSAALQLAFYSGHTFPVEYQGDAFVAFHGSWNRALRTGYKIERVRLKDGVPTGEVEDFVTGFVVNDRQVWGRPVGVAVSNDGSLLFSEDGNGSLWRVSSIAH